ncbi:MAG: O-antigen ligase family protein [Firmicutes bacterium]|nr:O-antigen ligase family protein [Bacillota bacterium]
MNKSKLLYGIPYLILLSVLTLFFWTFQLEQIGFLIFLAAIFLIFVLFKNVMPSIPILLNSLFMISQTEWTLNNIPLYLYLTPIVLILGIVIHIIRFKVNIFKGKMTLGIALMFLAMLLSSINAEFININYIFYGVIGLVYAFIYFFYVNSIKGNHIDYLLQMMMILGVLISFEVLIYYIRVEDVLYALEHKTIDLGWGISNFIATYLIMFIPTTFYFAKTSKINFFWIFLGIFEILMLFFTLSRGGILAFLLIFILVLIFLLKSSNWKLTLLNFALTIAILTLLSIYNYDLFSAIYDRFMNLLLDDSGRIEIYKDAIATFLAHPLFGAGIFARLDALGDYRMYHNTILHTMATFGAVGLIGLLIQFYQMFRVFVYQLKPQTLILSISVLGAMAHGMIDNVYFMPQFMIMLFIIIAVVENSNKAYLETHQIERLSEGVIA